MPATQSQQDVTRRAEHRLAIFVLSCLVVSLLAGFIAHRLGGYSIGSFAGAGLLFGIVCGAALFGRKAGLFRRDSRPAARPAFRHAALVLAVLFMIGGGWLVVSAAVHGNPTMLLSGLNAIVVGLLFIFFSKRARDAEAQPCAPPNDGPARSAQNPDGSGGPTSAS
jgi:hypothetical protein